MQREANEELAKLRTEVARLQGVEARLAETERTCAAMLDEAATLLEAEREKTKALDAELLAALVENAAHDVAEERGDALLAAARERATRLELELNEAMASRLLAGG